MGIDDKHRLLLIFFTVVYRLSVGFASRLDHDHSHQHSHDPRNKLDEYKYTLSTQESVVNIVGVHVGGPVQPSQHGFAPLVHPEFADPTIVDINCSEAGWG